MLNVITEVVFEIELRRVYNGSRYISPRVLGTRSSSWMRKCLSLTDRPLLPTQTLKVDRCARGRFQGSFAERLGKCWLGHG